MKNWTANETSVWCGGTQIASCLWVDRKGLPSPECAHPSDARKHATKIAAVPDMLAALERLALAAECRFDFRRNSLGRDAEMLV